MPNPLEKKEKKTSQYQRAAQRLGPHNAAVIFPSTELCPVWCRRNGKQGQCEGGNLWAEARSSVRQPSDDRRWAAEQPLKCRKTQMRFCLGPPRVWWTTCGPSAQELMLISCWIRAPQHRVVGILSATWLSGMKGFLILKCQKAKRERETCNISPSSLTLTKSSPASRSEMSQELNLLPAVVPHKRLCTMGTFHLGRKPSFF